MDELEIVQHRQIDGLTVFFNTVDYRTPHVHSEWELIWLLDQPLSVTCKQRKFTLFPGHLLLFAPNEPHEFHRLEKSATFLCLQLSPRLLPQLPWIALDRNTPEDSAQESQLKQQMASIAEAYLKHEENYELYCIGQSLLVLHSLLSQLPYHILSEEEVESAYKRNARLNRLIQFVDENYMHKIRLRDFAEAENCSLSYLSRFIKDAMNMTFQDYVFSVRFNCARNLILNGNMHMLDVCMESGFSDYRYFSRAFQRQYHMTPEQYSQYKSKDQLESARIRHSLHSSETFYTKEESLALFSQYCL